jgi:glycosyltransferase involved in cell wall biosynthesis
VRETSLGGLTVIIPTYNEESRISRTLRAYASALRGYDHEILVELDGCEDGSADVVRTLRREFSAIRIVEFPDRLGKGRGVIEGMRRARGEWVAFVDADGSLPPSEFLRMFATALADGYDGAIASRYWDRARIVREYGFLRWLASRNFNSMVRLLYRLPFRDTQCGAKVFRREAIESVIDSMKLAHYAFDVELLWRLERAGFRIREIPVTWTHKDGSSVRVPEVAPRMLFDVLRLRVRP